MGNHTGKDSHGSTGSPLDFFQTPPTTPPEAVLNAMMASSRASSDSATTPETAACTTPVTPTSPLPDWTHKLPSHSEWAVISVDSVTNVSSDATAALSLDSAREEPPLSGSPSEQSWQERDSGLEPQAAVERASEEMSLVLLSLMEHYQSSMGLAHNTDLTSGAVELLRHLVRERDELSHEVQRLSETLRTERVDWQQFQRDLQVAVSVADRLRQESEQAMESLQEKCKALQEQLNQALTREKAKVAELEDLKADHKVACCKLIELTLQKQQAARRTKQNDGETEKRDTEGRTEEPEIDEERQMFQEVIQCPENSNEPESASLTGKGVAECYLAALEKKKDRVNVLRGSRKIVMLSERSWSLSRLPLPSEHPFTQEENTSTTLPLCKKEETDGMRRDRVLQQQDSWSSFYTVASKKEEDTDSNKPRDGFSALLRRYGGSKRNSLLRWCQERTQGYGNIDITNFSSSWEDGLAFCALFHSYLPGAIVFDTLKPDNKNGNLDLAFKTGESVGITATLTVEDMLKAGGPDWQKVLSYVESIFRNFEM
ncbi:cytospin-A-like [Eucyclogobius newberryi]|uniref:cytospin-A-like n=1 Tax=Eucyclogobius newberryi TaxID=166745 RepID=UPI003B5B856F